MLTSTVNAIEQLIAFFTDEEKNALSINLNNQIVSLEEQFCARWFACKPRYQGVIFKAKAAHIISSNKYMVEKLITMSAPDFQRKMMEDLLEVESYINIKSTKQDGSTKNKNLKSSQSNGSVISRGANKTRAGTADSGQEYVEIEKIWDKEDYEFLNDDLNVEKVKGVIGIAEGEKDILDRINLSIIKEGEEKNEFSKIVPSPELEEHEPTLHTVNTNQTRTKTINNYSRSGIEFGNNKTDIDSTTTQKESAKANVYNKFFSFKLRDIRELFLQKLDVLFTESCQ